MAKQEESFADASVLLIDPDKGSRDTIRTILHDRGFRKFRFGQTNAELAKEITKEHTDVLITETDLPDGDPCELIAAIRRCRQQPVPADHCYDLAADPGNCPQDCRFRQR